MNATTRTRLGPVEAFADLPATLVAGGRTFFLVRDGSGFGLLSTVCPHQGGAVYDEGSRFECRLHGWRFDRTTGRCLNAPSRRLTPIPVVVEEGTLYADLPREPRMDHVRCGSRTMPGLSIHLHAHACLEIWYEGFTLLTDPWLDGPAFLGSWAHYPPPDASGAELMPDAILITHEHSDHFHETTLRQFDRATPIYVPDFPNQRLQHRLRALGFVNVTPMRFGEPSAVHGGWTITAFEPESYWNDAFLLIDIEGFRIFDINDAGVNARIARMVAPVDVLAVQFSAGASGYPWTWAHLSDQRKVELSARACAGKLELVREATRMYGASAVLPFASHFTLWHPSHRAYARAMKRNTLDDVRTAVAGSDVELIDLLPGERWDVGTGTISRVFDDRAALFEPERLSAYMETAVADATFTAHHPADEHLSERELTDYFERLNLVPEIVHCENLTVRIRALASTPAGETIDASFAVDAGRLRMLSEPPAVPNLDIAVPLGLVTAIIRDGLSWDEAFVGYWCRFDRHPNVYHAGFWRLLQAPYFQRRVAAATALPDGAGRAWTVAELLETHGARADRILRRYGLYCNGCHHSIAESIEMAARQHGVDTHRLDMLVRELNQVVGESERVDTDGGVPLDDRCL